MDYLSHLGQVILLDVCLQFSKTGENLPVEVVFGNAFYHTFLFDAHQTFGFYLEVVSHLFPLVLPQGGLPRTMEGISHLGRIGWRHLGCFVSDRNGLEWNNVERVLLL